MPLKLGDLRYLPDATNGLTLENGYYKLGGTLTEALAFTLGDFGATFNQTGTGDVTFVQTGGTGQVIIKGSTNDGSTYPLIIQDSDAATVFSVNTNGGIVFSASSTVEYLFMPIADAIDGTSAPAAIGTVTSGSGKVNARLFTNVADTDVLYTWQIPGNIDTSTGIKFRVITNLGTPGPPVAKQFQFELCGFSLASGEALGGTLGTAQTSNSGVLTESDNDMIFTAWSSALTSTHITGFAAGETAILKLYRDVDDNDDYDQPVYVVGLELKYKITGTDTF